MLGGMVLLMTAACACRMMLDLYARPVLSIVIIPDRGRRYHDKGIQEDTHHDEGRDDELG